MDFFEKDIFQFSWEFENISMLWWLFLIPLAVGLYVFYKHFHHPNVKFSYTNDIESLNTNYKFWKHLLFGMQMAGLAFFIMALAGPIDKADEKSFEKKFQEGIDIVIAIDVSTSMLARDFKPDRITVAKEKAIEFINDRVSDRIGLSVYEGESYLKVPITTDHKYLKDAIEELVPGNLANGTAIGLGLGTAVNGLIDDTTTKSKVIILLTDGVNNQGSIAPLEAAKIAQTYGITVYTIGIGSNNEKAPFPVQTLIGKTIQYMPVKLDEEVLKEIASITGGKYFRATSEESLASIYKEIDQMEKSKIKVLDFKVEPPYRFHVFVILGMLLFFLPIIINKIFLRSIA